MAGRRRTGLRLAACMLLAGAACSHTTPYVRAPLESAPALEPGRVAQRLLLIGDAGDPDPEGAPALEALRHQASLLGARTTVIFLGDNVYERGMPEAGDSPARREAERRVDAQVAAATAGGARAIFVAGNHDWDPLGAGRAQRVRNLDDYLTAARPNGAEVSMRPRGGCPGPAPVPLGSGAVLLALDTEWLLAALAGDSPDAADCAHATPTQVQQALQYALAQAAEQRRWSIVVAHHPLRTHGPHGGFGSWRYHLFPFSQARGYVPGVVEWIPLPVVGSLLVGLRACCSPTRQDLSSGTNRELRTLLEAPLREARQNDAAPLLYAAGHDHSLQVFFENDGPHYSVVSGLGSSSKATPVGHGVHTLFAQSDARRPGFVVLDFLADGGVRLGVIVATQGHSGGEEVYSVLLSRPPERP